MWTHSGCEAQPVCDKGLKDSGYLPPDNSIFIHIYSIVTDFIAIFSLRYFHVLNYWLPRIHTAWVNFRDYTSARSVLCNAVILCKKLVLLPPSTPARSIPLLSPLTVFPVAADSSQSFEVLAHQPMLGLLPRVIFLLAPSTLPPCTQQIEGSLGASTDPGKGSLQAARPSSDFPIASAVCSVSANRSQETYSQRVLYTSLLAASKDILINKNCFLDQISLLQLLFTGFC